MIYACSTVGLLVFFPRVFFHSRVTGACPVTTDLIMRFNVRTEDGDGIEVLTRNSRSIAVFADADSDFLFFILNVAAWCPSPALWTV